MVAMPPPRPSRGVSKVVVSRGCSGVEVNIFQRFVTGFSNCEEDNVVVCDEFIECWSFFIELACTEQCEFEAWVELHGKGSLG